MTLTLALTMTLTLTLTPTLTLTLTMTLTLTQGEWSTTCNLLGVTKTVDKFATAIGLIVNMNVD